MQFTYRGVAYQASVNSGETVTMDQAGMYRGIPCQFTKAAMSPAQLGVELTYRGVRYGR